MDQSISFQQRIKDLESRVRKWKRVRFYPSIHIFATRSTSIDSRKQKNHGPANAAIVGDKSLPHTSPLPRKNFVFATSLHSQCDPRSTLRSFPEFPSSVIGRIEGVNCNDDSLNNRIAEIKRQSGRLNISGQFYQVRKDSLKRITELGSGTCGVVFKARFEPTLTLMAVKQMALTSRAEENKRVLMDLDVVLRSHDCPHIVQCYGCFINDFEVLICMELMATCLEKLSKRIGRGFPEDILGKMAVSIIKALNYLKDSLNLIHRDVKPSNILLDQNGTIKLCDFGIAGGLVDSLAKTRTAGCSAYMSPERLEAARNYDIRADVWSVGISLIELAKGHYPYQGCRSEFEMLSRIVSEPPPKLSTDDGFTGIFCDFVSRCVTKEHDNRPKYKELLNHEWIVNHETADVNVAGWFEQQYLVGNEQ